jgi:hypothetical protein
MARTKTLSAPRPRSSDDKAAVGARGGQTAVKRTATDRRADTVEGRRTAAVPGARPGVKKAPVPEALPPPLPAPDASLTEEEQIESAKYFPRHVPKRVFEEERFLFPESYGVDRVRLLVKDPEWLFAYWDLSPRSVDTLRRELGERGLALTRLTLRVTDPAHGGTAVILLPYGARAWYVRADAAPRSYRALLGWTLPSGKFRVLAESNVVVTPPSGPSSQVARRRVRHRASPDEIEAALSAPTDVHPGPWRTEPIDVDARTGKGRKRRLGGASDAFRR